MTNDLQREKPFFSIVMPVYNAGAYLRPAIDSVLMQRFADFELIVVDDASTDGSAAVCADCAKADARARVIRHDKNRGLSAARNSGLYAASGEYILFMDADDALEADALFSIRHAVRKLRPDVVLFGLTERYESETGALLHEKAIVPEAAELRDAREVRATVMELEKRTLFGYAWNKAYRAAAIAAQHVEFEDIALIEDFLFNIRFFDGAMSAVCVDRTLYNYRIKSGANLTARHLPDYFFLNRRRIEELIGTLEKWGCLTDEALDEIARIYMRYALSALARNCDPRTMKHRAARRHWIQTLYKDPLFRLLRDRMTTASFPAKAVGLLFSIRWTTGLLIAGRLVYLVKDRLPGLFARLKQSR